MTRRDPGALAEALALLEAARTLLARRNSFTKLAWARDSHGVPVDPLSQHAKLWCVGGALIRAGVELGSIDRAEAQGEQEWRFALNRLTEAVGGALAWSLAGEFWNELSGEERKSLERLLEEVDGPIAIARLTAFNDRRETRQEHVLAALDRTVANFKRAAELPSDQDAADEEPEPGSRGPD